MTQPLRKHLGLDSNIKISSKMGNGVLKGSTSFVHQPRHPAAALGRVLGLVMGESLEMLGLVMGESLEVLIVMNL